MTHKPEHVDLRFKYALCGHVHEKWQIKKIQDTLIVNVGVDVWNFKPISINEILSLITKWRRTNERD